MRANRIIAALFVLATAALALNAFAAADPGTVGPQLEGIVSVLNSPFMKIIMVVVVVAGGVAIAFGESKLPAILMPIVLFFAFTTNIVPMISDPSTKAQQTTTSAAESGLNGWSIFIGAGAIGLCAVLYFAWSVGRREQQLISTPTWQMGRQSNDPPEVPDFEGVQTEEEARERLETELAEADDDRARQRAELHARRWQRREAPPPAPSTAGPTEAPPSAGEDHNADPPSVRNKRKIAL